MGTAMYTQSLRGDSLAGKQNNVLAPTDRQHSIRSQGSRLLCVKWRAAGATNFSVMYIKKLLGASFFAGSVFLCVAG